MYKKITLKQGTVVVDATADVDLNDWLISTESEEPYQSKGFWIFPKEDVGVYKIIASSFFIDKDIPMYIEVNEKEKLRILSQEYREREEPAIKEGKSLAHGVTSALHAQAGFMAGYIAAQEKGCYTEEDLRKCIDEGAELGLSTNIGNSFQWRRQKDEIIKSLKNKQVEFEMINEPIYTGDGCHDDNWIMKTTKDENEQLLCYIKEK